MVEIETKILKVLYVLETKREKLSDEKFLEYCRVVKKNILKAFEERKLTKENAKLLLRRANNLLELAEKKEEMKKIYRGNLKICPECGMKNTKNANFCRGCGYEFH